MSEQNFVQTHGGTNVLSQGSGAINEPTLDTGALRTAAKALLTKSSPNPAPSPSASGQPSTTETSSVTSTAASPIQRIPVSVSDAPSQAAPLEPAGQADGETKVTTTDAQGNKTEINLADIPDDAVVRMKVNGEIATFSGKEAKEFGMRGGKFTREMQQLRAREEQFGARLEQAGMLEELVTNDAALVEYIAQAKPQLVEALAQRFNLTKAQAAQALAQEVQTQATVPQAQLPQFNPADLPSFGEVDQLVAARSNALQQQVLEQVRQELGGVNTTVESIVKQQVQNAVKAEIQMLRHATEVQSFDVEINKTIDGILEANPALKAFPNINQVLRWEVKQMRPKSPEEMHEAFNHVAAGIVENLDETYNTSRKTAVITKAVMEKTGIEPPAGTAPTFTRPISYSNEKGQVDWSLIKKAARASLG